MKRSCFPAARRSRFEEQFGLSEYDASVIINQGRAVADYFETVATTCGDGKQAVVAPGRAVQLERRFGLELQPHPLDIGLERKAVVSSGDGDV